MYTSLVRLVLVLVAISKIALAQPSMTPASESPRAAFEACKDRRHAMTVEAMKSTDIEERGRRLAALVECQRPADGTTEVIAPTPPLERIPHATIALLMGVALSRIAYELSPATSITGPFAELEGGWRFARRFSLAAFAGYTGFHDEAYLGGYNVRHSLFDVGARVRLHFGSASVGAGAGVEIDDAVAFADVPGYMNPLVLVTLDAKYEVSRVERFGVVV